MVFRDVRLNGLTTGKKLKTFSIMTDGERRTYFGDDQATDTLLETQPYNKYSMYDLYHGHIVHNMYSVEKTNIRSTTRVKHDQNTIEDFLNICLPGFRKEDVVKAVQNGSYTYVLMAPTVSGFVYSVDGQKYQQDIDTYLYRSVVSCEAGPFPTRQQMLSCGAATAEEMFQPAFNLQNIKYNYVIEIPNEYVNGYFDDATVLGDGINTKNHLGYDYRMHITDTADAGKISPEAYSRKPVAYDGIDGHVIDVVRSFTVDGDGDKVYGEYYFETEFGVYRADTLSDSQAKIVPTATIYDLSCEVKQINRDGTALIGYNIASEPGVTQINCLYEAPGAYMAFTDNVLSVFGLNSDGPENEIISCDNAGRIIAAFKAQDYVYIQNESFETFAVQASVIDEAGDIADFETLSAIMTRVMFTEPLKRRITGMYAVYVNQHVRYFMWAGNDLYMSDMDTYNAFQLVTSFARNIHDMTHAEIRNGNQPGQPSDADDIMYIVYGEGRTATNPLLGDFTYSYDFLKFNFESSINRRWRDVNFPFSGAVRYVEALSSSLLAMDGSGAVYSIPLDQVSKYIGNMASFNVIFSHNRIYTDIKKHGEEIYLKYTTPRRYEVASINIDGEQYGMNGSLSSFTSYSSNTIFNLSCEPVEDSQDWVDGYQKIESIRSVNRFRLAQHKSNAYSIEINDSGINSAEFDTPEEREMLKSDIENNIRDIVKTIAPANTQFLNVKWSGK